MFNYWSWELCRRERSYNLTIPFILVSCKILNTLQPWSIEHIQKALEEIAFVKTYAKEQWK